MHITYELLLRDKVEKSYHSNERDEPGAFKDHFICRTVDPDGRQISVS